MNTLKFWGMSLLEVKVQKIENLWSFLFQLITAMQMENKYSKEAEVVLLGLSRISLTSKTVHIVFFQRGFM